MRASIRGTLAAIAVVAAGQGESPLAWILAIVAGFVFYDLARREVSEGSAPDWTGWSMQIGFLLVLCGAAWDNRNLSDLPQPGLSAASGFLLIGLGVWLRRRTAIAMGRSFKVRIQGEQDQPLVQSGPFRLLRHPSYASLGLVAVGTALATTSPTALIAAAFVWLPATLIRVVREETFLAHHFGATYAEYAGRTWRFLPGIF